MADPRKTNTNRIGTSPDHNYTWLADGTDIVYDATQPNGSAVVGRAVMVVTGKTIRLTADATPVLGRLESVEPDGYCAVKEIGTVQLPGGTSATLTAGSKIVGALLATARGYIRAAAPAVLAEVAVARHTITDATTTTAVEVELGR